MNAGRLDTRIRIERAIETVSTTGAVVKSWSTLATVWSGVRYLKGREIEAASQIFDGADVIATVRSGGDGGRVHEQDRFVRILDEEVFEVKGVLPIPGNRPQYYELYSTVRRDIVSATFAPLILETDTGGTDFVLLETDTDDSDYIQLEA